MCIYMKHYFTKTHYELYSIDYKNMLLLPNLFDKNKQHAYSFENIILLF